MFKSINLPLNTACLSCSPQIDVKGFYFFILAKIFLISLWFLLHMVFKCIVLIFLLLMLIPLCLENNALYIKFQCPLNLRRLLRRGGASFLLTFLLVGHRQQQVSLGDDTATRLKISDLNHYTDERRTLNWNTQPGDIRARNNLFFEPSRLGSVCYISLPYPEIQMLSFEGSPLLSISWNLSQNTVYILVHTI